MHPFHCCLKFIRLSSDRFSPSAFLDQTQLARAVAGEAQAAFICVSPSDVLSKFVGESEASIRGLFKEGGW